MSLGYVLDIDSKLDLDRKKSLFHFCTLQKLVHNAFYESMADKETNYWGTLFRTIKCQHTV